MAGPTPRRDTSGKEEDSGAGPHRSSERKAERPRNEAAGPQRSAERKAERPRNEAAGQVLTFLIAFAVFVPAFTLLIAFTRDNADTTNARVADLDAKARLTIDQLVADPGRPAEWHARWETGQPDALTVDNIEKVGLRESTRAALDYAKLRLAAGGALGVDATDGKLNYEECRIALGLPDRYGFHLRSYPVISANAGNGWGTDGLPPVRVAYIGQWDGGHWNGLLQMPDPPAQQIAASANERAALLSLNVNFRNTLYSPGIEPAVPPVEGDVYPAYNDPGQDDADGPGGDPEPYLFKSLFAGSPPRANEYDVIVVGSDVNPQHFGTGVGGFQSEIEDWVNDGNLLLVLGTDTYEGDWLADVLGANPGTNVPGELTDPDDSHAFLSTPNHLDVNSYEPYLGDGWDLSSVDGFSSVIEEAGGLTVLGLSNDGRYANEGAVFLSSIQPGELADQDEAERLLANTLVYKFLRPAYIDFGPHMDEHALARSSTRIVPIEMQSGAAIDAKVVLFMWRAG